MNVRCFVGIELPPGLLDVLEHCVATLRTTDPRWAGEKWVRTENLHVTTCFIGDVDTRSVDELAEALSVSTGLHRPFELGVEAIVARPRAERARMLWSTMTDDSGGATELARSVAGVATSFGMSPSDRPYAPHITLCRARRERPVSAAALEAASTQLRAPHQSMSVVSATLFSSRLTSQGPVYERLAVLRLEGQCEPPGSPSGDPL